MDSWSAGGEGIQEIPKEDMEPLAGYGNDVVVVVQSPEPSGNRGYGRPDRLLSGC